MENREYQAGSEFQIFGAEIRKAREPKDCTVEQKAEEKRKIAEFVRVRCVEAIQQAKVAGQCVMR